VRGGGAIADAFMSTSRKVCPNFGTTFAAERRAMQEAASARMAMVVSVPFDLFDCGVLVIFVLILHLNLTVCALFFFFVCPQNRNGLCFESKLRMVVEDITTMIMCLKKSQVIYSLPTFILYFPYLFKRNFFQIH
jgi:hypothetical protein